MARPQWLLLLLTVLTTRCANPSEGIAALRAASIFEGLMVAVGLNIEPHALPRAIGPRRTVCSLHFEHIYVQLDAALVALLAALSDGMAPAVPDLDQRIYNATNSLHEIGHTLRSFASACHRCNIKSATRLSVLAEGAFAARRHDMQQRHPLPTQTLGAGVKMEERPLAALHVNVRGVDRSSELMRAGQAMHDGRYLLAGMLLVLALESNEGGGDDGLYDDGPHDPSAKWSAFEHMPIDQKGRQPLVDHFRRLRQEHELDEYYRQRRESRRRKLLTVADALEAAEPNIAALTPDEDTDEEATLTDAAGGVCCCCWSHVTEKQEILARGVR